MSISIEPRAWPAPLMPPEGRLRVAELLRLPRRELARVVREEIERNPLLEEANHTLSQDRFDAFRDLSSIERYALLEDEGPLADDGPAEEVMAADGPDEIDWEDYPNHSLLAPSSVTDDPEEPVADAPSLYARLEAQLGLASLTPEEALVAGTIVANVDEAGFFRMDGVEGDPLIAVAAEAGVGLDVAAAALRKLQRLDPPGVCARDLRECLALQGRALRGEEGLAGLAAQEPADGEADALIQRAGDGWMATVDDPIASLRLSRRYRHALRRRGAAEEQAARFLSRNLDAAMALIAGVRERQRLVLELARDVAARQLLFLERGPAWIRPVPLARIAIALGEDEARVGHAAFGKLVDTPHGVLPLSEFFRTK